MHLGSFALGMLVMALLGEPEPSPGPVAFPIGSPGLLLAGSIMLIVSQVEQTKYRKWLGQRSVWIQPSVSIGATAMHVGLTGRF
jgi:hypothetical protein